MLTIDIGNTRIKIGVWNENELIHSCAELYKSDNIERILTRLTHQLEKQKEIIVSSVANEEVNKSIKLWFSKEWGSDVLFVETQEHFLDVKNGYATASQLGVDRFLAMVAAYKKFNTAVCVIDCGTAVTVDIVNKSGQHLGGLIMPGLRLMQQSLLHNTDGIKQLESENIVLADNTSDAVYSGCMQLLAIGLEGVYKKYKEQLGDELLCIVTGGDGEVVSHQFNCDFDYEKDLVLLGLQLFANNWNK